MLPLKSPLKEEERWGRSACALGAGLIGFPNRLEFILQKDVHKWLIVSDTIFFRFADIFAHNDMQKQNVVVDCRQKHIVITGL